MRANAQAAGQNRRALPPPRSDERQERQDRQQKEKSEAEILFEQLRARLNNKGFRDRVAAAVPEEFRRPSYVDNLCESIFIACRGNPKLLTECDQSSLFRAAERIAKRGLTVGENMAWLVPYNGEVQDQLGYLGVLTLAMRGGLVRKVSCQSVFANDRIEISLGSEPKVLHAPTITGPRGDFIGAYAVVWYGPDLIEVEWMPKDVVDYIRSKAPSRNSPAWQNWYDEMARAKVLKRACKKIPRERLIDLDDLDDRTVIEGTAERLDDAMGLPQPMRQIERGADIPMNVVETGEPEREREPAQQKPRQQPKAQQATQQTVVEEQDEAGDGYPDDGEPAQDDGPGDDDLFD